MTEMNKEKFLKFMVSEIERNQKDMYKTNEGKKVVEILTQIYTLTSDGKFDLPRTRSFEVKEEIESVRPHGTGPFDYKKSKDRPPIRKSFDDNMRCSMLES